MLKSRSPKARPVKRWCSFAPAGWTWRSSRARPNHPTAIPAAHGPNRSWRCYRNGIRSPSGQPSHGPIWQARRSLSGMAALDRRFIAISCYAMPSAGLRRRSCASTWGAAPFVFGRTGLWHHHRRRGHGAVADKRHCLFALRRRAGAGRLLGCLVAVQPQRGAS